MNLQLLQSRSITERCMEPYMASLSRRTHLPPHVSMSVCPCIFTHPYTRIHTRKGRELDGSAWPGHRVPRHPISPTLDVPMQVFLDEISMWICGPMGQGWGPERMETVSRKSRLSAGLWAGSSPASGLRVRRKPASAVWVPSLPPAGPGT